jgi:hypothetical protein
MQSGSHELRPQDAGVTSTVRGIYLIVAIVVFLFSFFKIADLDFWWHLKTGQIILQQKQFQYQEIYSFTSAGRPYVDHEWLFQVFQYLAYAAGGAIGVILLKCALLILIYLLITNFLIKKGLSLWIVFSLILLSIAAGRTRFIERPEIFTELFLVISYLCIESYLSTKNWKRLLLLIPFYLLWANIHAAVILGLVLQSIVVVGLILEKFLRQQGYPVFHDPDSKEIGILISVLIGCTLITGINPNGFTVLKVPFELTSIIESGLLNNQEWQQPPAWRLPIFYFSVLLAGYIFVSNARRLHLIHFLMAAFLGYISLKYVRNVALFSIMMPLLVWQYLSEISWKKVLIPAWVAILIWSFVYSPFEFGPGIAWYFPDQIALFTKETNLRGHMLNSYAFGGYLIWALYPERKIFIDGRNEVYLPLLKEIVHVRTDSRLWGAFLEKYSIEYTLLNYVDDLEELTTIDSQNNQNVTYEPFSSTHFPRTRWALIYWDDDGMILVKRNGVNTALTNLEYTSIFPEGDSYMQMLVRSNKIDKARAIAELQRKLKEDPQCKRAKKLLAEVTE